MFEDSVNSFAHVSTRELRGQLNLLSMVSFSSILRSLRVYILNKFFFLISVNSGRIFTLRSVNVLPLLQTQNVFLCSICARKMIAPKRKQPSKITRFMFASNDLAADLNCLLLQFV